MVTKHSLKVVRGYATSLWMNILLTNGMDIPKFIRRMVIDFLSNFLEMNEVV